MPNQKDRVVLVVRMSQFDGLLLDAGVGHRSTYDDAPAFVGTFTQFGRLMVAATEILGSADAILLATTVRHTDAGGVMSVFYFPGLELS